MADELRKKCGTSIWSHFHPDFLKHMKDKQRKGQPVRLVDLYGQFIGDCLLDVSIKSACHLHGFEKGNIFKNKDSR